MSTQRLPPGSRQVTIFEGNCASHTADYAGRRPVACPDEAFRPDLQHGLAWCPYCAAITLFAWDTRLKKARCPRCSIGTGDYYVAQINRLCTDIACEAFAAAVRRAGLIFDRPLFFERGDSTP